MFRPANRPIKLSDKMMIPSKSLQFLTGDDGQLNQGAEDIKREKELMKQLQNNGNLIREWTENETPLILNDEKRKVSFKAL